jgi:hypothetical protein
VFRRGVSVSVTLAFKRHAAIARALDGAAVLALEAVAALWLLVVAELEASGERGRNVVEDCAHARTY